MELRIVWLQRELFNYSGYFSLLLINVWVFMFQWINFISNASFICANTKTFLLFIILLNFQLISRSTKIIVFSFIHSTYHLFYTTAKCHVLLAYNFGNSFSFRNNANIHTIIHSKLKKFIGNWTEFYSFLIFM